MTPKATVYQYTLTQFYEMALKWVLRTFLSVLIKRPGRKFHIKFSLNVLVNLKIRALNKYKNRSYNRNQRVHSFLAEPVKTLNCVNGSYSRYEWSHLPIILGTDITDSLLTYFTQRL